MIINKQALQTLFTGFNAAFNKGLGRVESHWSDIALKATSVTAEERYGWLGRLPRIREWIGDRVVQNLSVHGFTIRNRTFESTVSVARTDIEDDHVGVYGPIFEEFGREVAEHPDRLVFGLLADGFTATCYDGQCFFDVDHGVTDENGDVYSVSNMQEGDGPAWFLLDTSRAVRPLIYQERVAYNFTRLDNEGDENVFYKDEYIYGTRGRSNVGFGLWQLAFASKAPLTPENYGLARAAMSGMRGDGGAPLGIRGTTLVVPSELEGSGRRLVKVQTGGGGAGNEWFDSAELIVTPWLAA